MIVEIGHYALVLAFVLALFQTAWLAGLSMFGIGFAIAFIVVPAQTLMQQETRKDMLGRVSSSLMAVFSLSQLLGLLLSGALANQSECDLCSCRALCC